MEIQSLLDPSVWRYCPGSHNPADLPSRGLSVSQLRESQLWWKGPSWLQELEKDWPEDLRSKSPSEAVQVERKSKAVGSCVVQTREPFIDYARFSKYSRLLRTVERRRETFNSFNWTRDTRGRRMADSPCTENKF